MSVFEKDTVFCMLEHAFWDSKHFLKSCKSVFITKIMVTEQIVKMLSIGTSVIVKALFCT